MARTGRPRKPTHLKLLEGTYRRDRAPAHEPHASRSTPSCPADLDRAAKAEWRRIIPHLREMGTLSAADRATIALYCQALARWRECERALTRHGMTFQTRTGYVAQRPEATLALKWSQRVADLAGKLGLHPQGRAGVRAPAPAEPPADPAERFLFGRKA